MSHYEVIARKWRPQEFQNLVGQNHIAQTLLNALTSGRIPHALLFTGPRGTGKTSTARIFAKALRCTQAKNFIPCQVCSDCQDIALGRHIDVIEIDGASNNGVDSIRELRDSVGYLPSTGKYKIYIVDEVHMLSTSAFNALLKTLEEPPSHVVFVLATTEVQKIPNTILSRCQRFDFKMISQKEIAKHLGVICESEQVKYEKEALWMIAKQAKGSMRDSQSLLDQIISFSNKNVTTATVAEVLGLTQRELINQALAAVVQRDQKSLISVIARFAEAGHDPQLFIEDFLDQIRNALMVKIGAHQSHFPLDIPDSEILFLTDLVKEFSEEDLHLFFDMTLKGSLNLLRAPEPRMAFEMLLLKLLAAPRVVDLEKIISGSGEMSAGSKTSVPLMKPTPKKTTFTPDPPPVDEPLITPKELPTDPWLRFVEQVRGSNSLLAALIEHTFIIEQTPTHLKLGLPEKMSFLVDKIKDPKNLERLQGFLENFWKQKLSVEVSVNKGATASMTPKQTVVKAEQDLKSKEKKQVEEHPLVKKAQSIFKSEIVSIKEKHR
ncbi:MAG: DNA polymerase III subunit gamma/tau [Bdellovibrionales bacterium]|nr:DNA polymerase III subunit gamma/tau [Bdellovibrionales bacterium]